MILTGESEVSIDAKLRLAIPAKFRGLWKPERDGPAWVCVPWPSGVLRLYTETHFHTLASQIQESLTPGEDEAQRDAVLFGLAERLEVDAQGRIMLPRSHLKLTGLGREIESPDGSIRFEAREVVVVGARNRLEIHDRIRWNDSKASNFATLAALVARADSRKSQP